MTSFNLIIRAEEEEPLYPRDVAAELARISLEMLAACEQERLIRARAMTGGGRGYSPADVRQLARIRRLCEHLELDLDAVEVVLHMRQQIIRLLDQMERMELQQRERERKLILEIERLRRQLARESDWR